VLVAFIQGEMSLKDVRIYLKSDYGEDLRTPRRRTTSICMGKKVEEI